MSSEIQSILNAFEQIQHQGKSAFLATVVRTQGSTYRRPGARLLIAEDGQTVGLVSGGCLERDLFEHTQQRMPDRQAKIVTYDRTATEGLRWWDENGKLLLWGTERAEQLAAQLRAAGIEPEV